MMKFFLLIIACTLSKVLQVSTCGLSTHVEIGHMAATIFHSNHAMDYRKLILKHQDAFQAGNTYPDSYYYSICFNSKYRVTSEDSHWTAFTNVTLQYIRDNFPPPWTEETEKLVVFVLGFISHQVADVSWHSLGIRQGFIRTMAAVDFHGVYDTAHSAADFGGDVVNEFRGDYSYLHYQQWYIPVTHLANIYQLYYNNSETIPTEVIVKCTSMIFLAVLGEKIALGKVYEQTAVQSPFLTQNLDTFFLGGLYDMALWTTRIWDNVIYILEHGFSANCTTPDNPLYIRCDKYEHALLSPIAKEMTSRQPALEPSRLFLKHSLSVSDMKVQKTKHGVIFRLKPTAAKNAVEKQRRLRLRSKQQHKESREAESPRTVLSTKWPYARLGHVLLSADVNSDGIEDLVISSPMYPHNVTTNYAGAVFVLYGREEGLPEGDLRVEELANVTLRGDTNSAGRFGSAVAVLDANLDGYKDIIVSSPNWGWTNLTYTGGMSIWFGNKDGTFGDRPSMMQRDRHAPLYDNEGITLLAADINRDGFDDLVVGSPYSPYSQSAGPNRSAGPTGTGPTGAGPQSGKVCFILSSKTFDFSTWKCIWGPGVEANNSWFGSCLLVADSPHNPVLIVGAPIRRNCAFPNCTFSVRDTQSVGQLTIWSLPDLRLLRHIEGTAEHEHFGSSFSIGRPFGLSGPIMLAVGRDSVDVNGSVFGYDVHLSQAGAVNVYNLSCLIGGGSKCQPDAVLHADRKFSLFSAALKFVDLDSDGKDELVVGAPHFTDDPTELLYGVEQGIVYVFGGGNSSFPKEDIDPRTCANSWVRPCPSRTSSRLLSWREDKSHFGHQLAVLKVKTNPSKASSRTSVTRSRVVVSALRSSHGARQSGAVLVF